MQLPRVDDKEDLLKFLEKGHMRKGYLGENFSFFCPRESQLRRAKVEMIEHFDLEEGVVISGPKPDSHSVLGITCVNCKHKSIALLVQNNSDYQFIFIHKDQWNSGSPNTDLAVKYYLDQANKSHSMGANSASVAMFRAALEQLLYHQGFQNGMLDQKIRELEAKIKNGTAPDWAVKLDTGYLDIIKQLGNTSIHPNKGDIRAQDKFNSELISALQITFSEILDAVYEEPARKVERRNMLAAAVAKKTS